MSRRYLMRYYEVYDGEEKVFEGDKNEVAQFANCKPSTVSNYAESGWMCRKKYFIKYVGKKEVRQEIILKLPGQDDPYERIKRHLEIYGNTIASEKELKLLENLEKEGIKVTVTKFQDALDDPLSMTSKHERKKTYHYLLERT